MTGARRRPTGRPGQGRSLGVLSFYCLELSLQSANYDVEAEVNLHLRVFTPASWSICGLRGKLVATPVRGSYELEELLAGVSKGNLHGEVSSGEAVGREIW